MKKLLLIMSFLLIPSMLVFAFSACKDGDDHGAGNTTDESVSVTEESSSTDESEST